MYVYSYIYIYKYIYLYIRSYNFKLQTIFFKINHYQFIIIFANEIYSRHWIYRTLWDWERNIIGSKEITALHQDQLRLTLFPWTTPFTLNQPIIHVMRNARQKAQSCYAPIRSRSHHSQILLRAHQLCLAFRSPRTIVSCNMGRGVQFAIFLHDWIVCLP